MSGLFITFEGVEGAGKTTQIALLKTAMESDGRTVCVTREPGGDALAEAVRRLVLHEEMTPRAELLLFLASRAQNVERVIRPHLAAGEVVLCDRFTNSSLAYQGYGRDLDAMSSIGSTLLRQAGCFRISPSCWTSNRRSVWNDRATAIVWRAKRLHFTSAFGRDS